jgi:diaminopimelate epimerase
MRIFNADGSEAEMCGNGARCAALFAARRPLAPSEVEGPPAARRGKLKIETKAGVIQAQVRGGEVKIKLTDPKDLRLNIPIKINNRALKVNFINTGVPHTVVFVEGLEKIDVAGLGRQIRYHQRFKPAGTNVDFVQVRDKNSIQVRTYERGVEDETLACGTGAVASALITIYHLPFAICHKMNVIARSKELLRVSFDKINGNFRNVWLEGSAKIVYQGEYHV